MTYGTQIVSTPMTSALLTLTPIGEPETVTVEGVFTSQAAADAAYADAELTGWDYFTVEQHEVTPTLNPLATAHREIEESQDVAGVLAALARFEAKETQP